MKCALEYTGYLNAALGKLDDIEIANIEKDVQRVSIKTSNVDMLKCFEKFENNPADFRFLAGERAIMKMLAATVKKRGINYYFRKDKQTSSGAASRTSPGTSQLQTQPSPDSIREKVVKFYEKRYVPFVHL